MLSTWPGGATIIDVLTEWYYNTPMLHFGPYVTFQPCECQILAHCTSLFGALYVTFWPCCHAHKRNSSTPTTTPWHGPKVILGQGRVCLIMKIKNPFRSLGRCTKSSMWSLGSAEVVWGLGHQLQKSDEVVTAGLCGLWVRSDGRRSSSGRRETRYQLLTGLHRDLQQNNDTVDRVTDERKWENIHRWAWCERHSIWHSKPTGVGNRSLQWHDTDLHINVSGKI